MILNIYKYIMDPKKCFLKGIKSKYIIINIFSCCEKRIFLNIIRHNKSIQQKLDISIEDYETTSGRYIKKSFGFFSFDSQSYEEKTLDTGTLIFTGFYKNGRRDGEGKEYYENKILKFEGEYSNGIKIRGSKYDKLGNRYLTFDHGNGEEKYNNKKSMFVGGYYNGKRWNGIGYDINGNEDFEIKCGKGKSVKEYFDDGKIKFEGEYYNGERNGKGKRYDYEGGIIFEGEYLNGERWKGFGKEYYTDKEEEEERRLKNMIFQKEKPKKNNIFDFNFSFRDNGDKYLYRYTTNNLGFKTSKKILKYEGEYLNGKKHGKGKEFSKEGILEYEGEFMNGKRHGQGKLYDSSIFSRININPNLLYEGEFVNGEKNGKGKEYDSLTHNLKYEGVFRNGKFIG